MIKYFNMRKLFINIQINIIKNVILINFLFRISIPVSMKFMNLNLIIRIRRI
jgi:hypothetical protein